MTTTERDDLLRAEARSHAIANILASAANLVNDGWARDVDARNQRNRACNPGCPDVIAWAAQGALRHATERWRWDRTTRKLENGDSGPLDLHAPELSVREAMEAFAAEIGRAGRTDPEDTIREWNRTEPGKMTVIHAFCTARDHYHERTARIRKQRLGGRPRP